MGDTSDLTKYTERGLITPKELADLLAERPGAVKLLDASYAIGVGGISPESVFQQMRIGEAQFFDIDAIADTSSSLPHMLPTPEDFATAAGRLGISNDDFVVVYDQSGIAMAACRAWWMFRVFGHDRVCVLDGGLPAWQIAGLTYQSGPPVHPRQTDFTASFRPSLVTAYDDMRGFIERGDAIILDARPPERFAGLAPEPRPGLDAGHMPGARSLPAGFLIDPATRGLKSPADISLCLRDLAPADGESPVISTCGSGVTACVIALAFFREGRKNVSVYDGSWSEWGLQELHSPIVKGFE